MTRPCTHLDTIVPQSTPEAVCPACLETGDSWVHLRQCLACGNVGCCDSSKNHHATNHFKGTHHPIVESIEEGWRWCYEDKTFLD